MTRTTRYVGLAMKFNRDQWIESFEGQLAILRPHLTQRVLATMSLAAWHAVGVGGADPIGAARALDESIDASKGRPKQRIGQ